MQAIEDHLFENRVLVLYGARQVGKTTLVKELQSRFEGKSVYLNCDEPDIREGLEARTSTELQYFFGDAELVILDEAQRVKDIGLTLKLAADSLPKVQIIATGSSSFDLANKTTEPLTGRKYEFHLHPVSYPEFVASESQIEAKRLLDVRLIYGSYPAVITSGRNRSVEILQELTSSYLYKDILAWKDIRHPEVLEKLLRALALQIGSQVSHPELGNLLGIDKATVESYIRLLEQAFVIFRLPPYSTNQRNELKKMNKVYFWDTGIRNALIQNLNPPELRADTGALWENYVIAERLKATQYTRTPFSPYFWRTHQQQEVDYVEDKGGQLLAAEIKRNPKRGKGKLPLTFTRVYPNAKTMVVTQDNLMDFLSNHPE